MTFFCLCLDKEKEVSQSAEVESTADLLDKQRCLDSLAPLRHAKWFQVGRRCLNRNHSWVLARMLIINPKFCYLSY